MIRIVKLLSKYYGKEIDSIEDDYENIEQFVKEGNPVIIAEDLSDLKSIYDLDIEDIEMVEP